MSLAGNIFHIIIGGAFRFFVTRNFALLGRLPPFLVCVARFGNPGYLPTK